MLHLAYWNMTVSANVKTQKYAQYPEEFTSTLDILLSSIIVVQVGPDRCILLENVT